VSFALIMMGKKLIIFYKASSTIMDFSSSVMDSWRPPPFSRGKESKPHQWAYRDP